MKLLQMIGIGPKGRIMVANDKECWEGLLGDYKL
jgi:hypothetical protein